MIKRLIPMCIVWMLFIMGSCEKDEEQRRTFECTINGEKYKNQEFSHLVPPGGAETHLPVSSSYRKHYDKDAYLFNVKAEILPVDESSGSPEYDLEIFLYLEEPLVIGREYSISLQPDHESAIRESHLTEYVWNGISFCSLRLKPIYIRVGEGKVKITKIDEEELMHGEFEFDIASPQDQEIKKITGFFRSTLKGYNTLIE